LSGTGTVGALKLAGGILAPGASPGVLSAGNTEFSGGTFALEINGLLPGNLISNYDQLNVVGSVSITQPTDLSITFGNGFVPTAGDSFSLINNDASDSIARTSLFRVAGVPIQDDVDFMLDGRAFQLDYNGGDGNDRLIGNTAEGASDGTRDRLDGGAGTDVAVVDFKNSETLAGVESLSVYNPNWATVLVLNDLVVHALEKDGTAWVNGVAETKKR
jgi:hypothetical protein